MSSFNAINLIPQDDEIEAEEHTRELQIEEGFQIYQEALVFLNDKKFEESNEKFKELFKLDVIVPDKWGVYRYSTPIIDRLRYLAFRNRGMYYYTYLSEIYQTLDPSDIVNYILKVLDNLIEALQHGEPDLAVTELLVQLFRGFKSKKLERLILENEITKSENQLLLLGRRRRKLLPQTERVVNEYCTLLKDVNDADPIEAILSRISSDMPVGKLDNEPSPLVLNGVLDKIKKMKTEDEHLMKSMDMFEIKIDTLDWDTVASSISNLLPYAKMSNLLGRNSDPYNELEDPIEAVKFVVKVDEDAIESGMEKTVSETTQDDASETTSQVSEDQPITPEANTDVNTNQSPPDETSKPNEVRRSSKRTADTDSAASRIVQRSSKRFKERDTSQEDKNTLTMSRHRDFLNDFKTQISVLNYSLPYNIHQLSKEIVDSNDDLLILRDLYDCLNTWTNWHTDIFRKVEIAQKKRLARNDNRDEIVQLNTLLRTNILEEKNELDLINEKMPITLLRSFIDRVNHIKPHFHELRIMFLLELLGANNNDRLFTKYVWPELLVKSTISLVLGIEKNLYNLVLQDTTRYWMFGLSILEILVNVLGDVCQEMLSLKAQSNKMNDLKAQRNKLEKKINNWMFLLQSSGTTKVMLYQSLYLEWIRYCYVQLVNEITDNLLVDSLEKLSGIMKQIDEPITINYPNCKHIPTLTTNSVQSQLNKINIVRNISLVECDDDDDIRDQESVKKENMEHMTLLESILMKSLYPAETASSSVDQDMVSFISESPFQLQVKLWGILFSYYCNSGDSDAALRIYFHFMGLLKTKLVSKIIPDEQEEIRKRTLLFVLSTAGTATENMLQVLKSKNWNEPEILIVHEQVQNIYDFFFIFYSVLYYESIAKETCSVVSFSHKAVKSFSLVKSYFVSLGTMVTYLFCWETHQKRIMDSNKLTVTFISNLHELFGSMSFCDTANGYFLLLSENLLCRWIIDSSYEPFKQVLWCRYHYSMSTDSTSAEQHNTKVTTMSKENAIPLGIYLLKYQYQNINPLLVPNNKSSLKQVLENIIETVGNVEFSSNHILNRNEYLFNEYLGKPITTNLFRSALNGERLLNLTTPYNDLQEGMDAGIFYVASIHAMNLYKIKKKSMQARPSELDSIRKTLKVDVLYNTQRSESWYLLGKCFSYIVEDDLIWTSDKISTIEKKKTIAITQRKAILCYLMAISIYNGDNDHTIDDETIIARTYEALGNELVSGYYKPMDKLCFSWQPSSKILHLTEEKSIKETVYKDAVTISEFNIEQSIVLCFRKSNMYYSNSSETNWWSNYSLGRILFKLDRILYGKEACSYILKAAINSSLSSAREAVIEPHYYLINICYKMVAANSIGPEDALTLLAKDNEFFAQKDSFWKFDETDGVMNRKDSLYRKIIVLLRSILSHDKKKLQHRPQYRTAKILYHEFKDINGALEEMENMVSIKASKNLINIWKPEYERPGKHFVYAHDYLVFYITLLLEKSDFNSIALVIKKVRRFGAGVAYVNEVNDFAVKSYNESVEKTLNITDKKYIETLLPSLNYQDFLRVSKQLLEEFKYDNYEADYTNGLKYAFQLKKGNNGIAFDSVCLSIYFKKFYLPKLEVENEKKKIENQDAPDGAQTARIFTPSNPPVTPSKTIEPPVSSPKQGGQKKRVSKKEAFDRIRALVDKCP